MYVGLRKDDVLKGTLDRDGIKQIAKGMVNVICTGGKESDSVKKGHLITVIW